MFHSPTSVDNRSVRLGRVVMFLITAACTVFVERGLVKWVVSCGTGAVSTSARCVGVISAPVPPAKTRNRVCSIQGVQTLSVSSLQDIYHLLG